MAIGTKGSGEDAGGAIVGTDEFRGWTAAGLNKRWTQAQVKTWTNDAPTFTGIVTVAGQIAFPAAQNASANANTLDDYEEGTFTPGITFGGAAVSVTYSTQAGRYTKIGDVVIFTLYFILTSKGSSVGTVDITGLPFTGSASEPGGRFTVDYKETVDLNVGGGYYTVVAFLLLGTTTMRLREIGDNVAGAALTDVDFANASVIGIAGHYHI